MADNLREASKKTWTSANNFDSINAGSLQRIADAVELMAETNKKLAADYDRLKRDKDWYEREYDDRKRVIKSLEQSRAGYNAQLTRLRREIANGEYVKVRKA